MTEDLAPLFADFGVTAVFGSLSAVVLLDMPDEEIFGGAQLSTEYVVTYRRQDLASLKTGDVLSVDGTTYKVRQITRQDDGQLCKAMLKT